MRPLSYRERKKNVKKMKKSVVKFFFRRWRVGENLRPKLKRAEKVLVISARKKINIPKLEWGALTTSKMRDFYNINLFL